MFPGGRQFAAHGRVHPVIIVQHRRRAQELQRSSKWRHLWRIAGQHANISVFDVADHDELHAVLSSLPLFPFMEISVTPLARHPSAID